MAVISKQFGKPISKTDADVMFKRFKAIKERSHTKIIEALEGDPEAIRFYVGRQDGTHDPIKEDLAFIFTKESLVKILEGILTGRADGLVLFNAARGEQDSVNEKGEQTDYSGRPTLIMAPFKFDDNRDPDQQSLTNLLDEAYEHPGTGGGGGHILTTTPTTPGTPTITIPEIFKPWEIHGIKAGNV